MWRSDVMLARKLLLLLLTLLMGDGGGVMGKCPAHGTHPCICNIREGDTLDIDCESKKLTSMPDLTVFKGHPIHTLILAQNDISTLPPRFLDGLIFHSPFPRQSASIDLSGNTLSSISPDAFVGVQSPDLGLLLQSCSLHQLPSLALSKMANWTFLFLDDNQISSLNKDAFVGLRKLRHVELSGNPIKDIHKDTFSDQRDVLRALHLNNMQLNALPVDVLQDLTHLHTLTLDDNQITVLPPNAFNKFRTTGQMTINLRRNHLNYIPHDTFTSANFRLKNLRLDDNELSRLDFLRDYCAYVFSGSPSVSVNDNPINCNCNLYDVIRSNKINLDGACAAPQEYYDTALGPSFLKKGSDKCEVEMPQQPCESSSANVARLLNTPCCLLYALLSTLMFLLPQSVSV